MHAESIFQSMKAVSDPHLCHLLRINSRPAGQSDDLPDPWSQFLARKVVAVCSHEALAQFNGDKEIV